MTLTIKEGRYYLRADGKKCGPASYHSEYEGGTGWTWNVPPAGYEKHWYGPDGKSCVKLDKYHLIAEWTDEPETQPETGTLAELNVKPGWVLALVRDYYTGKNTGEKYLCREDGELESMDSGMLRGNNFLTGADSHVQHIFRIVSRASPPDTPKLWRDMTPEEKGALLLAHHEGKAIEWTRSPGDTEFRQDSACGGHPVWDDLHAYRVKPKPKPEPEQQTQRIVWTPLGRDGHAFHSGEAEVGDWVLTFETEQTEDGIRPIPITLRFEEHF